jgi:hypothetical protein
MNIYTGSQSSGRTAIQPSSMPHILKNILLRKKYIMQIYTKYIYRKVLIYAILIS